MRNCKRYACCRLSCARDCYIFNFAANGLELQVTWVFSNACRLRPIATSGSNG